MDLRLQLVRDEGLKLFPYVDTAGKTSIGCGRNLTDVGISEPEAALMLENDIRRASEQLALFLPWTDTLDEPRRGAFINLTFNLGINGLLGFKRMLAAAHAGSWVEAANELIDSDYGRAATKNRAARLAKQLVTGVWQ